MERSCKTKSMTQRSAFILVMALIIGSSFNTVAHAEWHFGIGTGLSLNNIDGTQGFNSLLLGPVKYDVKLNPQDFNDYTKTAFGFGGYATNGTWMIQYSYGKIELEDKTSTFVPSFNSTATVDIDFKMTGAELTVGYPVYKTPSFTVLVDGGLRYTKHEFDNSLTVTGAINIPTTTNNFDHNWTDVILGASLNVPFADTWSWNSRANAGFGGSDGTYLVSTGVTWRFHKNWSTSLTGKFDSVDYENGSQGESDWYYYDANESSLGLNILFNW